MKRFKAVKISGCSRQEAQLSCTKYKLNQMDSNVELLMSLIRGVRFGSDKVISELVITLGLESLPFILRGGGGLKRLVCEQ